MVVWECESCAGVVGKSHQQQILIPSITDVSSLLVVAFAGTISVNIQLRTYRFHPVTVMWSRPTFLSAGGIATKNATKAVRNSTS